MSMSIWPPLPLDELVQAEKASVSGEQARELEWLLESLQDTLASIKSGLEECVALLAPVEPGSTLVLSSPRSDSLKGFVTRVGTKVKMYGLPPLKGSASYRLTLSTADPSNTLNLSGLIEVRNLINQSLDVIDVSAWTGDSKDANFISGQLRLLFDNIQEARQTLKGPDPLDPSKDWAENPVDPNLFDPPLPSCLSFHLSIVEAALQLQLRTMEPVDAPPASLTGFDFRSRLAVAIGASKIPTHDERDETFRYKGEEVRVKEKVRVESQDPNLMAMMAKLAALEHNVALSRKALDIVMGKED
ncbi:MAG: hypothetical protein M1838_005283 [Thelocarpon superellum]|nr:MAG: hypothetical protein M1838_005283 [Thelocarpon superellum]